MIDNLLYYDDVYSPYVQKELYEAFTKGDYAISEIIGTTIKVDMKRRTIQYGQWRRLKQEPARTYKWDDPRYADGVPILARKEKSKFKVNLKSHTAFDRAIVTNKRSYFVGKNPDIEAPDNFLKWLHVNDFYSMLSEIAEDATGQGEGFTLLYSPEKSTDAYITKEQSYNCVIIYNPDTEIQAYGIIYMPDPSNVSEYEVYFYDAFTVSKYKGSIDALKLYSEPVPHLFTGVPLIEWRNNSERISDNEPVLGLMDIYDTMDSDLTSELSQLRLAYLLMKKMGLAAQDAQEEQHLIEMMVETGLFVTDDENASLEFIGKDVNHEAVKYAKESLKERIFQMANSYDPVTIQGTDSGVTAFQIRMKLFPLEQSTIETELQFKKAFMYMYRLLSAFYSDFGKGFDGEVDIKFKRNVPSNIMQDIIDAKNAGFRISQNQLSRLVPFYIDQEENEKELQEEQASLFVDFNTNENNSDTGNIV